MTPRKPIPTKRPRKYSDFRDEAISRLRQRYENEHERPFTPEVEPKVTPILKSAEGGLQRILEALRAHDEPDAKKFITLYDSLSGVDKKHLSLEEIATASGIGSLRLAEVSTSAIIMHGQMQSKILIASAMPKVMRATIKAAVDEVPITAYDMVLGVNKVVGKTNGDVKAMEMFHKITGMMPTPKGATIAIQNTIEKDSTPPPMYLDPSQRLRQIHEAVGQRRLPAPPSLPIGGKVIQMQEQTAEILAEEVDVL